MTITSETALSGQATVDWDDTAMSATDKRVTDAVQLIGDSRSVKDVSWQPAWTDGTGVTGAFGIDVSNNGQNWQPLVEGTGPNDFQLTGPAVNANTKFALIEATVRAKFARLTYTNASNTGTLDQVVPVVPKR